MEAKVNQEKINAILFGNTGKLIKWLNRFF